MTRHRTPAATRPAIVAACRGLMPAGRLRPSMRACSAPAGWSVSTGHLRGSRDAFRRIGNIAKAAHDERRLAAIETRAPEPWALEERDGGTP